MLRDMCSCLNSGSICNFCAAWLKYWAFLAFYADEDQKIECNLFLGRKLVREPAKIAGFRGQGLEVFYPERGRELSCNGCCIQARLRLEMFYPERGRERC